MSRYGGSGYRPGYGWGGGSGGSRRGLSHYKWSPSGLPQTLQFAVYLLYWNAVIGLLFGLVGGGGLWHLLYLALVAADAAGGLGVANQKKWGYVVALAAAFLPFVLLFLAGSVLAGGIISLIFEIVLVVLLLHPMSRSYFRIYFR